ncbi:Uncharacterized conserved protein VgrG [Commensalibacter communis]|uniref:hypothetical protein n=1 Tax=Commensalibacter communis TaxID=2972786 RepID=UPI0022FF7056|nr:hypothetical protein [Commensalibacter communis]CAI3952006.1 Uncharacterized conserved protein VgrG [Commensalibacter communis]CAI3952435.1 Uncharacterized conserved protein VgrG [Commensalibacter communis]
MENFLPKPICSPPPLSAFTDGSRTRPTEKEMARRRNELKIIVTTGLGSDVDRYVSQSPTLVKQILKLKRKKWQIGWGSAGTGTFSRAPYEQQKGIIVIDSNFNNGDSQNIAYVTSTLAHEVGHSYFHKEPDLSSFDKCMESLMVGGGSEADAIVNQIVVRNEILKEACIDIFEEGREYDFMKNEFFQFYGEGIRTGDMKTAKMKIAKIYSEQYTSTSNPPQKYKDSYGDYCKKYAKK